MSYNLKFFVVKQKEKRERWHEESSKSLQINLELIYFKALEFQIFCSYFVAHFLLVFFNLLLFSFKGKSKREYFWWL